MRYERFLQLAKIVLIAIVFFTSHLTPHALAFAADGEEVKESRQLPRFVSIRSKEINLRTGPGERYPIDWVLRAKGWPLQVVAEYENWRRVKDWDGNMGWVHRAMLSNTRAGVVQVEITTLRRAPDETGTPIAQVQKRTHAQIKKCENNWCDVKFASDERGWLPAQTLWGAD
jgi:SH3-like domain-containing protein